MNGITPYSDYDSLAWFYNKYWGESYHKLVIPILQDLVLAQLPPDAPILDLCCGTGHLTRILAEKGYRLTGIDGSEEMLHYARENAPSGEFISADARAFALPSHFDAVVSTFESLNHIMSVGELKMVFRNVHAALRTPGVLFFDLVTEQAYKTSWNKSNSIIEDENVCIIRGGYDPGRMLARTEITMFRLEGTWQRSDVVLFQRHHDENDVCSALEKTGFRDIRTYGASRDFNMPGDLGMGRTFFLCSKKDARDFSRAA